MNTISKKVMTAALAALALTAGSLVATGEASARGHGGHGGHAHFGHGHGHGHFAHGFRGHHGRYAWHGHFRRYGWYGHYRHYGWRYRYGYRHYGWRWYGRSYAGGSCWIRTRLGPVYICNYYYR
jgi:hypothetical protein